MGDEMNDLLVEVKKYLELEHESGMDEYFFKKTGTSDANSDLSQISKGSLEELRQEVLGCRKCHLADTRTNVVFGSGDPVSALMFVGEAPGEDEDLQGLPFVGRAGQLLTKIIEAMGLKRSDVYIANILKCRPPNNRAPLPTEIFSCAENVRRQIELINPRVICTLGKFASQTLLKTETAISALRGNFYDYNGIKVMPTFHPAYLLRNPGDKKLVWLDMKKVLKELNR